MNVRTPLRWAARIAGGLAGALVIAYGAVHLISVRKARASVVVAPHFAPAVDYTDPALVAEGQRVATIRGCVDCHAANLGGKLMIDDPLIGKVYTANLTTGKGGRGSEMTPEDWELAIRHGVRRDGSKLAVMPAPEFATLTDRDIAAIVAFVRTIPPVDNIQPRPTLGPLGRALHVAGELDAYPAGKMAHPMSHRASITPSVSLEFGEYVAHGCTGCHNPSFSGGKIPGTPPSFPKAANITPDSAAGIGRWTEADFIRALREGVRPDGTRLDPFMPVQLTKHMTDTELRAAYLYLRSIPAKN